MQRDGFQRAERLFHEALALTPVGREQYINQQTGADCDLAQRVRRMIAFAERPSATAGILADAAEAQAAAALDENSALLGVTLGPYRLSEQLGSGGFGVVYRAEQEQPIRRSVALKILRSGMDSSQVIARFDGERQALALMEHPNIARVLDAGRTPPNLGTRPYVVMELVGGTPITDYCDAKRLNAEARLNLFLMVCEAVQHAHQKGVIHRDLKPSNILIAEIDGTPTPKVIDFGIAKALERRLTEHTLVTEAQQLLGTPQYMSPEQADMDGRGIDTRSDIYSLGVILYELLTGTTPIESAALRNASFSQMQKMIQSEAIERPSTRVTRSAGEAAALIAQARDANVTSLQKRLRGDLDWITLKALEHDRERRYSSASALADDIRRHQRHEPVQAGPPTAAYRIRKFVRRNRVSVIAAALVGLALVGGAVGTTVGMLRARDAAAQATSVNEFMRGVLTSANPDHSGADVRLIEVLQTASDTASQRFADHPQLEAQVRGMLADVYTSLSMWDGATRETRAAGELWRDSVGPDDPRTLRMSLLYVQSLSNNSRWREAEQLIAELAPRIVRILGPDHELSIDAHRSLGLTDVVRGRVEQGEQTVREAYQRARQVGVSEDLEHKILNSLVRILGFRLRGTGLNEKERSEFEALAGQLVDTCVSRHGEGAIPTLVARLSHGRAVMARGDHAAAAEDMRAILRLTEGRHSATSHIRADAASELAEALYSMDEKLQAAEMALLSIEGRQHESMYLAGAFQCLPLLEQGGRWSEGEALARQMVVAFPASLGGHDNVSIGAESFLAAFVSRLGRFDEADVLFGSLLSRKTAAGEDSWAHALVELHFGDHLRRKGDFTGAEEHLRIAATVVGDIRGGVYFVPDDLIEAFAALYEQWGKLEQAAEYRRMQKEVLATAPLGI